MLQSKSNALIVMTFLAGMLAGCAGMGSSAGASADSQATQDEEQAMVCQKLESRTGSRMRRTICTPVVEGEKDQNIDNAGSGEAEQAHAPA